MPDPLESFRLADTPVTPRPEFVRSLRVSLERAATASEGNTDMTTTPTTTTSTTTTSTTPTSTTPTTATGTTVTLAPYLVVHDAAAAIDFYVHAFGAEERYRLVGRDARVGHADLAIAGNQFMVADEYLEYGARGPRTIGGSPVTLHLQVPDADATVARAVEAGATLARPVEDQFYGERGGTIVDPFGHTWTIQSHIEDVSPEEMTRRWHERESAGDGD